MEKQKIYIIQGINSQREVYGVYKNKKTAEEIEAATYDVEIIEMELN